MRSSIIGSGAFSSPPTDYQYNKNGQGRVGVYLLHLRERWVDFD